MSQHHRLIFPKLEKFLDLPLLLHLSSDHVHSFTPLLVPETPGSTAASPPSPEAPDTNQSDPSTSAEEAAETQPDMVEISEVTKGGIGKDDGEQAEYGFYLFMKGGGCKDVFIAWEECIEDTHKTGEDIVVKCFEVTSQLKKYIEPILCTEQAMSDAVEAETTESATEAAIKDVAKAAKLKD